MSSASSRVDRRVATIVDYLARAQTPDGEFSTLRSFFGAVPRYATPTEFDGWHGFKSSPYGTATVAYHLADVDLPGLPAICRKGCEFLARGIENGVTRCVPSNAEDVMFPPDVDDTCFVAAALEKNGVDPACNRAMILDNVTGQGDVFTWLIPRWRHLRHPANYLWLARDRRAWIQSHQRHQTTAERLAAIERVYRFGREPGIAANVLLFLGVGPRTRKVATRLIDRVEQGQIGPGYYPTVPTYFHVARLYRSGASAFERTRERILGHLDGLQSENGEIQDPLSTALGALSFMYFGEWSAPALGKAVGFIADHPMHDEGWKPLRYYDDIYGKFVDGNAGVTAALYLEVLYRWQQRPGGR